MDTPTYTFMFMYNKYKQFLILNFINIEIIKLAEWNNNLIAIYTINKYD
jgi:hypothetical protein